MSTVWFTFIVAVQLACALCSAENKDGQNIDQLATQEVDNRIFKGTATRIENLPYQVYVSVVYWKDQKRWIEECGGAILHSKIIITAAHCVHKKKRKNIKVRAGSSFKDRDGVTRNVAQVNVHESYKSEFSLRGGLRWTDYDVALLKLAESLKYSKYIQNVEIPEQNDRLSPGELATIAGWGFKFDKTKPTVLQKTQIPVMSNKDCRKITDLTLNPRLFCAGYYKKDTTNTCDGDSGGPFVANNKIYGVVSAGLTDCKGKPSIAYFINISSVHTWLTTKLNALSK